MNYQNIADSKNWNFNLLVGHVLNLRKTEIESLNKITLKLCKLKCYNL